MPPTKPKATIKPFWQTTDGETVRLYHGHVIDVLKQLPSGSIQCCVTSPPYWGLRDYKTGTWEGGSPECDHKGPPMVSRSTGLRDLSKPQTGMDTLRDSNLPWPNGVCKKCGATRIDQQLGSEATPEEFIQNMVLVFREVRRVLRDDGTLWLNLGDSYSAGGRTGAAPAQTVAKGDRREHAVHRVNGGLPGGNLVGIPWRTALALQADGWILRSDIPWVKRSSMPESVKNRPAKSLEYVFLLTKSMKYYFDFVAVKKSDGGIDSGSKERRFSQNVNGDEGIGHSVPWTAGGGRSFRNSDPWFESIDAPHGMTGIDDEIVGLDVTTRGYEGAHFACYPPDLIKPMILAGTSEYGACAKCGSPWKRVTKESQVKRDRPNDYTKRTGEIGTGNSCANSVAGTSVKTLGWEPTCECFGRFEKVQEKKVSRVIDAAPSQKNQARIDDALHSNKSSLGAYRNAETHEEESSVTITKYVSDLPLDQHPVRPCRVLDTFIGSGTTCAVSVEHGRWSWGIDLSEEYLKDNAITRIEGALLRRPTTAGLTGKGPKKMEMGTVATIK